MTIEELDQLSSTRPTENLKDIFAKEVIGPEISEQLDLMGFFTDPASNRYHGSWKGGLVQHSLRVLYHVLNMYKVFCPDTIETDLIYAAALHDICKAGSYEISTRNVKKNGVWIQEPFYQSKPDLVSIGHGAESCRRIEQLGIKLNEPWYQAVRWHMGMFDATDTDKYGMAAAEKKYPEVLLLQIADRWAGIRENI